MKANKIIYVGLALLLSTTSLASFPARANVETATESTSNVENSSSVSSASESSQVTQSGSSSVLSSDSSSETPVVSSSQSSTSEPTAAASQSVMTRSTSVRSDAPTASDGVQTASGNGFWLDLILFKSALSAGFTQQPQAEQYVVQKMGLSSIWKPQSKLSDSID